METNIIVVQLRELLFKIDDQERTIQDLRSALFSISAQEQPVDIQELNIFLRSEI